MNADSAGGGPTFEHRLVEAIEPLRQLALAHALYALFDTGVHASLAAEPGSTVATLAARHDLDPERLDAFCRYLRNEGFLSGDGDGWELTVRGTDLAVFRPWFRLLVGGYGDTFAQLGPTLRAGAPWAGRNGVEVGAGACGMSMFDAVPLADDFLAEIVAASPDQPVTVVDVGCGDGSFLAELARRRSRLRGVGLEPDPDVTELARRTVAEAGAGDRVTIRTADALEAPDVELDAEGQVCYLAAFVLQELLEQAGEDAVVDLLRRTVERRPDAWWLVIEPDYRPDDNRLLDGLGRGFYNPYYLLHAITEQRLLERPMWTELFGRAGLAEVVVRPVDVEVDSTGLLPGFLLRGSGVA